MEFVIPKINNDTAIDHIQMVSIDVSGLYMNVHT